MNVWSKLLTALRGGFNEAGEALVDSQALRILDQEIRDADHELRQSREALAQLMARQKLAAERVSDNEARVAEYEQYALKALAAGNETLAREVAEKIASLEAELGVDREQVAGFAAGVARLRQAVSQAEGRIRRLKQQVDMVKATESVQRAQLAVIRHHDGSPGKLHTAVESLERLRQRQAERAARFAAEVELAAEPAEDSLEGRLRAAGIVSENSGAASVLARLKGQAAGRQA